MAQGGFVARGKGANPRMAKRNLAVQKSLMEIFDEFTEAVAGELKRMDSYRQPESRKLDQQG